MKTLNCSRLLITLTAGNRFQRIFSGIRMMKRTKKIIMKKTKTIKKGGENYKTGIDASSGIKKYTEENMNE